MLGDIWWNVRRKVLNLYVRNGEVIIGSQCKEKRETKLCWKDEASVKVIPALCEESLRMIPDSALVSRLIVGIASFHR